MKKILIFTTAYAPHIGGAEIAVREISKQLAGEYEFEIITYRFHHGLAREEVIDGVKVHRLGYGLFLDRLFLFPLLAWRQGKRIIKRGNIDLLWGVMVSYASIGAYALKSQHPQIPFLLTLQEGDSPNHLRFGKFGMVGLWWWLLLKKADYLQAISSYLADYALDSGAKAKVAIVPNGVDFEIFYKETPRSKIAFLRNLHGLAESDTLVITTSRLVHKNAVDVCIESLMFLPEQYKLLIVGTGRHERKLKRLARRRGLAHRVIFAGSIPHTQLPDYLHLSQVFVRPSRSEGLGNSFLEAMAAGTPVIGTPVGGIPDFLKDGETGLMTRVDDPKDLAEKIRRVTTDSELTTRLKTHGFSAVASRYTWKMVAADMKRIFEELTHTQSSL